MSLTPRLDKLDSNYIINGNFDFWQRGAAFTSNANAVNADRWYSSSEFQTIDRVSQTVNGVSDVFTCRATKTGTSSSGGGIYTYIESNFIKELAGKEITVSFLMRKESGDDFKPNIFLSNPDSTDDYSSINFFVNDSDVDNSSTVGSSFTRYTFTTTLPANTSRGLGVYIYAKSITDTAADTWVMDVAQVMVHEGSDTDQEFRRAGRNYAEELQLCQRYYEKSYDIDVEPGGSSGGAHSWIQPNATRNREGWEFKVQKRSVPTVTAYSSDGTVNTVRNLTDSVNLTVGYGGSTSQNSMQLTGTLTGTPQLDHLLCHWTADAEIT